jgi:hypothetical protein
VVSADVEGHARGAEVTEWITEAAPAIFAALSITEVEVRLGGAGPRVIPEVGSGGYATAQTVELQVDLDSDHPVGFQREWVQQLLAHEAHHVARLRALGNPRSVAALVTFEGMADHFAEDFGGRRVSPWSSALAASELETWVDRIVAEHPQRDYDVYAWLFGTTPEIPRWTGYSAGYAITGEYLALTGRSATTAVGDDADQIIGRVRSNQ